MRWLFLVGLIGVTGTAFAEPPGLTMPTITAASPVAAPESSYRLHTGLADLGSVALAPVLGPFPYLLGAPLVHLAHHHPMRALASIALRIGLPIAGALTGYSMTCRHGCEDEEDLAGIVLGGFAGIIAASAIDIGYLSRGEEPAIPPPLAPAYGGGSSNVMFRIGGSF